MFADLVTQISPLIATYGTVGVFFIAIIEEVVAPVPSSLVLVAAGFFLLPAAAPFGILMGKLFLNVVLPASAGLTIGSLLVYSVAYLGGKAAIVRFGRFFGVTWNRLEQAEAKFIAGHADELILFVLRAIPIIPNFLVSGVAGIVRYDVKKFIILTLLGSMVRAFLMGLIGWSVGEAYTAYVNKISAFDTYLGFGITLVVLGFGIWFFVRRIILKKS